MTSSDELTKDDLHRIEPLAKAMYEERHPTIKWDDLTGETREYYRGRITERLLLTPRPGDGQPDQPSVFEQRVAVLEGSIRYHANEMEEAKAKVLRHKQAKDARVRELFTYLKAQNTVLRNQLAEADRAHDEAAGIPLPKREALWQQAVFTPEQLQQIAAEEESPGGSNRQASAPLGLPNSPVSLSPGVLHEDDRSGLGLGDAQSHPEVPAAVEPDVAPPAQGHVELGPQRVEGSGASGVGGSGIGAIKGPVHGGFSTVNAGVEPGGSPQPSASTVGVFVPSHGSSIPGASGQTAGNTASSPQGKDSPSKQMLPGEELGLYYLIDLGHGDVLKGPGNHEVAMKHLKALRTAYIELYPQGATSKAAGHEPPFPKLIGSNYGPYPHAVGGEDDPTGFRSYGYVATLEGRLGSNEITRVRKPGGEKMTTMDEQATRLPPDYLFIDGTRNDLGLLG